MKQKVLSRKEAKLLLCDYLCPPLSPEEEKSAALKAAWPKSRAQNEQWVDAFFRILDMLHAFIPRDEWDKVFRQLKWPIYERK